MKIFIFSAFILGIVAMNSSRSTTYAPNDGMNSPGTFNSKSTAAATASERSDKQIPLGGEDMNPETLNSSPNPAPTKEQVEDSAYGETVIKPAKQAEEARPNKKTRPKQ